MEGDAIIRRHWWAAALIGVLAPGLGQLYTGRARLAACAIGLFFGLFALFYTTIPSTFAGFAVVFAGVAFLVWGSAVEAGLYAWRHRSVERRSFHRWYIYAAYAVAFALVTEAINMGLFASIGLPSMFGAYHPYRAKSESSAPNLMPGEYFLVATANGATKPEILNNIGSYVVVSWPGVEGTYIHRLVAVGGQTFTMRDGLISVDGKLLPRRELCSVVDPINGQSAYLYAETSAGRSYVVQNSEGSDFTRNTEEVTVPDDHFYVIGDSRDNSSDSRFQGAVANENFKGRVLFIFWSTDWRRIGKSLVPGAAIDASGYCPQVTK